MKEEEGTAASARRSGGEGAVRYALLSDIHANLPALEAVLADVESRGATSAYHLGDLVGYAPWPDRVVSLLEERGVPGIAGNYDSTVATGHDHCGCRYDDPEQQALSGESYAWTREHVSAETRRRLAGLPFRIDLKPLGGHTAGPRATLVHGAPTRNTLYWTEDRSDDFCRKMADRVGSSAGDAIVFGHTHVPWTRAVDGVRFVNAGSVGRPKDGDPRACYVLLESGGEDGPDAGGEGGWRVEHVRVEYDVERAARGVEESDLPDAFADHLGKGGA